MTTTITNALSHWKTTVNGVLAFLITTLTILSGFLGNQDLNGGGGVSSIHVSTWVSISVTVALALCRAWVGLLQQDAGKVPAIPSGGTVPELVASHEVPDDPTATVVVPPKP